MAHRRGRESENTIRRSDTPYFKALQRMRGKKSLLVQIHFQCLHGGIGTTCSSLNGSYLVWAALESQPLLYVILFVL